MPLNNKIIFVMTNLAFQAIVGSFGTYSIIKHPMVVTYDYDQQYLGFLEALQLFAQIIGSLSILFIHVRPVKGYLIFALINALFSILLCFPRYVNHKVWRDILVIISFFGQNVFIASIAFTQIIFSYFFDQNAKKCEHSVWFSITFFGETTSLIFAQILVYNIGLKWQFANVIWHAYIIVIGVLMFIYIGDNINEEHQLEQILNQQNKNEQINNNMIQVQQPQVHDVGIRKQNKSNLCLKLCKKITTILKQPRVFLVVISFGLIQGLYNNLVFWVPYYYIIINNQTYSSIAILGISVSLVVGGVLLEVILFQVIKLQHYSKPITYLMLVMSSAIYFIVWTKRYDEPLVQVILLFVGNFLLACPYSRISAAEPIQQAEGDQHKLKTIFLLAHLCRNVVITVFVLVIGLFMKRDSMSFWSIILVHVGLALAVETIRKVCFKKKQKAQTIQRQQN